ncbi:hypothetical protein ABIB90_008225 [Bradyrhizobium sp. JR4.1]|uniref:DUF6894 family protein n=1 Tax=Bradyrhizobium sp. JR4.1 TaxID=3156372 RepID=UPI00339A8C2C
MRYFFHIETSDVLSVDRVGTEFTSQLEADDYGARVASEIGMDDFDYTNGVVTVVDSALTCLELRNLVSRISRPSRVTSAIVSFRASEILSPVDESSAIKVACVCGRKPRIGRSRSAASISRLISSVV